MGWEYCVFVGLGFLKQIHKQTAATMTDADNAIIWPAGIVLGSGGVAVGVEEFEAKNVGVVVGEVVLMSAPIS